MVRARVIPVLLLRRNGLYKSIRFENETYVGDPFNAVRIFNEKEVDELLVLDILAGIEGTAPRVPFIREIASECFMPLGYGGGVTSLEQMRDLFAAGVEKVAVNRAAVADPELIARAAREFGSQSIVAAIDVRTVDGRRVVVVDRARRVTGLDPLEHARHLARLGAGELMVTSVDRDGTFGGYDLDLIAAITRQVDIPVIACGGAGSRRDLRAVIDAGASAAAAGSLFVFYGRHRAVLITYPYPNEFAEIFDDPSA